MQIVWSYMDKSALSDEGQELYDTNGYHELIIPFLHDDHDENGTPFYMTIDFVLDDELTEKYERFEPEESAGFLTKSRLRELLNKGYVIQVYDAEPVINDVAELSDELDAVKLFND